ncbi:MAG: putative metalloprotease CJM1_0395 family protein [Desulfobacteraceae bacterium]|nr:putative metalloprotease CJM1_0395 family protein [Desulfobacteraceae bacterium]
MADSINGIMGLIGQVGSTVPGMSSSRQTDGPKYAEPQDRVTISDQAKQKGHDKKFGVKGEENLTSDEKQQVNELKKRDAEVKAHEQAHMAAGGNIVQGGASYQYEHGPDGKMYAVGGEVKIDVSPERTPEATVSKMQQVQRAALAPAQPSATDRAVAARAAQAEAQARSEESSDTTQKSQESQAMPQANGSPGDVEAGEPQGLARVDAKAANPSKPEKGNTIFTYKSDLSPAGSRSTQTAGTHINLSV